MVNLRVQKAKAAAAKKLEVKAKGKEKEKKSGEKPSFNGKGKDQGKGKGKEDFRGKGKAKEELMEAESMAESLKRKASALDEEAFPRGGDSGLTPLEFKEIKKEVDAELFKESAQPKKQKVERGAKDAKEQRMQEDDDEEEKAIAGYTELRKSRYLTSTTMQVGMMVLGAVKKISELDLVLALPNMLTAKVPITEISEQLSALVQKAISQEDGKEADEENSLIPDLNDYFKVGQFVRASVTALLPGKKSEEEKKKLTATLKPSTVNKGISTPDLEPGMTLVGSIKSIEDHGYIVSFGVGEISGFLKKADAKEYVRRWGKPLLVGQLVDCAILSKSKGRTINVTIDPKAFIEAEFNHSDSLSLDGIQPGYLVTATVKSQLSNGLAVSFLESFEGSVHEGQLKSGPDALPLKKYKPKKKFQARVLWVDLVNKHVELTMQEHIVAWKPLSFSNELKHGQILEEVEVTAVEQKLLRLKYNKFNCFVKPAHLSDKPAKVEDAAFAVGTKHTARVLGFDLLNCCVVLTLKQSIVTSKLFSYDDVKPGQLVTGEVVKVEKYGMIVKFSKGIQALCPSAHLSDSPLGTLNMKLKIGSKVTCMVLSVDVAARKMLITNKKTLVHSELPKFTSFEEITPGALTHGFIKGVKDGLGCFVGLLNNIKGLVPLVELGPVQANLHESFHMGQVVKCRVKRVDPAKKELILSFNLAESDKSEKKEKKEKREKPQVPQIPYGAIVSATVISKDDQGIKVELDGDQGQAVILKHHLSDHFENAELLFSSITEGTKLTGLLALCRDKGQMHLTNKASLVTAAREGSLPGSYEQVTAKTVYHGYVRGVTDYGCFVSFLGALSGLASKSELFDKQSKKTYQVGQSVRAYVEEVGDQKIILSLKQSKCASTDPSFIQSLLKERELLADDNAAEDFTVGEVCKVTFKAKEKKGLRFTFKDSPFTALAYSGNAPEHELTPGSEYPAVILDVDPIKKVVDVSLKASLIKARSAKISKENDLLAKKPQVNADIEFIKENYLIISVPSAGHAIGFVSGRDFNIRNSVVTTFMNKKSVKVIFQASKSKVDKSSQFEWQRRHFFMLDEPIIPEGPKFLTAADFTPGTVVSCKVTGIKETLMYVLTDDGVRGRVQVSEILDEDHPFTPDTLGKEESPLKKFKIDDTFEAKVVGVHREHANDHVKHLAITHKNPVSSTLLELSLKPSELATPNEPPNSRALDQYNSGESRFGFILRHAPEGVWLSLTPEIGVFIDKLNFVEDPRYGNQFSSKLPRGSRIQFYIKKINVEKKIIEGSLNPITNSSIKIGEQHSAKVIEIDSTLMKVKLENGLIATVYQVDVTNDYEAEPFAKFQVGDIVKGKVVFSSKDGKTVALSLKDEEATFTPKEEGKPVVISKHEDAEKGMIVKGYIRKYIPTGCFVQLSRELKAFLPNENIPIKDKSTASEVHPVGKMIEARIAKKTDLGLLLTLFEKKTKKSKAKATGKITLESLKKGDVVTGVVKSITELGVFIKINDSEDLSGLCFSNAAVENLKEEEVSSKFSLGDNVKAKVLKVNLEKKRIVLGLKPSLFQDDDFEEEKPVEKKPKKKSVVEEEVKEKMDYEMENKLQKSGSKVAEPLPISASFDWDGIVFKDPAEEKEEEEQLESDDEEAEEQNSKKKNKKLKAKEKEEQEKEISKKEEELLDPHRTPQTAEDFERLLVASPNSSFLWIKFMAFYLSLTEIDKARQVAERALETISFREEQEKMNIWVAYLNLENTYGTQQTVGKVFERAVLYNEPKKIYLHLVKIYERTQKLESADQLYHAMTTKFKESSKVWILYGMFKMRQNKADAARAILQKSLKSLPKRKHIKTISKFAQMEFKFGDGERGRTIFEGIMATYPKRVDLWSIYLDMELRQILDPDHPRKLFERLINMKWSSKKMRYFFKRYLEFEKEHGDESTVEHVKQKAREYVESQS